MGDTSGQTLLCCCRQGQRPARDYVYVCICVCMCVRVYTYMHVYIHIYIYIYIYLYIYICVCVYVHAYTCKNISVYIYIRTCAIVFESKEAGLRGKMVIVRCRLRGIEKVYIYICTSIKYKHICMYMKTRMYSHTNTHTPGALFFQTTYEHIWGMHANTPAALFFADNCEISSSGFAIIGEQQAVQLALYCWHWGRRACQSEENSPTLRCLFSYIVNPLILVGTVSGARQHRD